MNLTAGFNADVARVYGIEEALLLDAIAFYGKSTRRHDGFCWFTSKEFELKTSIKNGALVRAIKHLVSLGVIEVKNTYIIGTQRKCRHFKIVGEVESKNFEIDISDYAETIQSESTETIQSDLAETTQSVNSSNRTLTEHHITKVIGETPAKYGNPEINELFEYWQEITGIPIKSRVQANRNACKNLISSYTLVGVKTLIRTANAAQSDQFAPLIGDFSELQSKANKLLAWGKKKGTANVVARF